MERHLWADYFDGQGIQYAFFSAANATALQQARREALAEAETREELQDASPSQLGNPKGDDEDDNEKEEGASDSEESSESESEDEGVYLSGEEDTPDAQDPRAKVLSVLELEDLFVKAAPDLSCELSVISTKLQGDNFNPYSPVFLDSAGNHPSKLVVGLVGYPNVGKSSTINSLLGEKKVNVSSTPGKTKHFQTIHLSSTMILCDCPGLVFPQFTTTKADLVCDGVLPIDQMREHTGPISLVVKRLPKEVLEATYGLSIKVNSIEEGGDGKITAENFLIAYAGEYIQEFLLILVLTRSYKLEEDTHDLGKAIPMKLVQRVISSKTM